MTIFIFITAANYFCKKSRTNPFCFDSGHTNKNRMAYAKKKWYNRFIEK